MEKVDKMESLYGILSEYMDCCVLVGYDFEGRRVEIDHFQNTKERDALATMLRNSASDYEKPKEVILIEDA